MKTFEQYERNPCYKDYRAFNSKSTEVCYIPENAEDLHDAYNYSDLKQEVEAFLEHNPDYLIEHETNIESLLINMYECLSWEFPSTFLDRLDY